MIQKNVIIGNLNIRYYQSDSFNKEKALIFLHGWQSEALIFKSLFDKAGSFIALDLPGFGQSSFPGDDWDVSKYADFLHDFLEKLEIKNPMLVGHSFGGRIIIKYNANYLWVKKNILISSAGIQSKSKKLTLYKIGAKIFKIVFSLPILNFFRERIRKKFYKAIDSEDYINAGKLQKIYQKIISEDLSSDMRKIKTDTILIWGENDTETPIENGKKSNNLISGSKLFIIEKAGHYSFLDQPEKFNEIFLKEIYAD